jgi:uncharacterized protein YecE (DUF72 family)
VLVSWRELEKESPQGRLFAVAEPALESVEIGEEEVELARRVGDGVRFGTMSWSYPGWHGVVYGAKVQTSVLAERGLTAYSRRPLLRAVEIDRTYYEPLPATELRKFAEQVGDGFRFVVKAHDASVMRRFPMHARYGKKRGELNALFLDARYATEQVVGPIREGLGEKLGAVLFQFPPQDPGHPHGFAAKLREFLLGLPRGPVYAVELRNRELLTPRYANALADAGAVHCLNVWGDMPSVLAQARTVPPAARRPLVLRWLMRRGDDYRAAGERYLPFNRLVDEDVTNREEVARLIALADRHGVQVLALVDNKAEGCAPESIVRLARAVAAQREQAS